MKRLTTDVLVIGGGSGGLSVAAGAVQMGVKVVLAEGHLMGGDCLNFGCVPSKALLSAPTTETFADAKTHVRRAIDTIAPHDSVERFEGLGVTVLQGYAKFISPTEVQVDDTVVTARRIVIATGSSPVVPPISGLADVPYHTNETIFDDPERPDHLLIIGGGAIGLEMAQAHIRLGSRVSVVEGAQFLGREDRDCAGYVLNSLRDQGVELIEGVSVASVSGAKGEINLNLSDGRVLSGSHLLVAAGRQANIGTLNLAAAGIEHTPRAITVNASLRTSNRRVYAIGDVAGGMQFTHVAGYHAGVIIRSMLLGLPSKARNDHIPYAIYTNPELAQVGLTEQSARAKYGEKVTVARFDFAQNDRLVTQDRASGLIKVMVVKGRPVGASIAGPQAGELIGFWSYAIATGQKLSKLSAMITPYPTVAEINKRVIGAYFSPMLFDNPRLRRVVQFVQRFLP